MLLAVDVGNTNTVFAIFRGKDLCAKWRISTDNKRTADEYAIVFKELIALKGLSFSDIKNIIISTVVPQNLFALKTFCREYFSLFPIILDEMGIKPCIKIDVDRPRDVGADRLVNAIAAYNIYKSAAIVIDFGTATTFDVVNSEGTYIGGVIAPGVNLSIDALHQAAAKLPEVAIIKPEKAIGSSTITAMQSGVYFGYLGLIEKIVSEIRSEYGEKMMTIATGGLAPLFADATGSIEKLEPDLTILGLQMIFENGKK